MVAFFAHFIALCAAGLFGFVVSPGLGEVPEMAMGLLPVIATLGGLGTSAVVFWMGHRAATGHKVALGWALALFGMPFTSPACAPLGAVIALALWFRWHPDLTDGWAVS